MAPLPNVLLVTTGGTISMAIDPVLGGPVPSLDAAAVLGLIPEGARYAAVQAHEFGLLPGPHMTPTLMWDLARMVDELMSHGQHAGCVITHGTDTLEETAFLLDLMLRTTRPVVLTGSMKHNSEPSPDGPRNLLGALRVAADPAATGRGVLVAFNEEVHAARAVVKWHSEASGAFVSPNGGPLAMIDRDRVVFYGPPVLPRRLHPHPHTLDTAVALVTLPTGDGFGVLDYLLERGAHGIVAVGTGRGNLPVECLPALDRAAQAGVPVVVATRCVAGRVLDSYAYPGAGMDLVRRGVIRAGRLTPPKARLALMVALGLSRNPADVRAFLEADEYGA